MMKNKGMYKTGLFILLLAFASISCGAANLPFLATKTPTPTSTLTPSPTITSSPSATPTNTPTSTPTPPPSGRIKKEQSDGSTLFIDYDGNYQITIPPEWLLVIAQKEDIDELLEAFPSDSDFIPFIEGIRDSQDETLRAFIFNFDNISEDYTPNINIGYQAGGLMSRMTTDEIVDTFINVLPAIIPDLNIVDSGITNTSSGIEVGFLKATWELELANGLRMEIRQKQVYINNGEGVITITLSEDRNAQVELEAEFDRIINSLQLLEE